MKVNTLLNKKGWIIPVIILILSIAGLLITINKSSFDFGQILYQYFIVYLLLILLHYLISSFPTPIYVGDNRFMMSFLIHRLSLVSGYLFPVKIGIPMKVYLFKRYLGISMSKTSAAVIFEATVSIGIIILGGISLGSLKYLKFDVRILLVFCLVLGVISFVLLRYSHRFGRFFLYRRINQFVANVKNSFIEGSQNLQRVLLIIGITFIVILLMIFRIQFLLLAIDEPLPLFQLMRAILIAALITTLSMVPGGYAVREASLSFFLVQEGVTLEGAMIVVFVDRIFTTGCSFLLGIISSLILMRRSDVSN